MSTTVDTGGLIGGNMINGSTVLDFPLILNDYIKVLAPRPLHAPRAGFASFSVSTQPSVRIGPARSIKPLVLTSNRVFNSVIVRLKRNIYFRNDINRARSPDSVRVAGRQTQRLDPGRKQRRPTRWLERQGNRCSLGAGYWFRYR